MRRVRSLKLMVILTSVLVGMMVGRSAGSDRDGTTDAWSRLGLHGETTVHLSVRDIDEAINWFERTLGFPLLFRAGAIGYAEVSTCTPGLTIGLEQIGDSVSFVPGAPVAFTVTRIHLETARNRLAERGARFSGPTVDWGPVRTANFSDPTGNRFVLAQAAADAPK